MSLLPLPKSKSIFCKRFLPSYVRGVRCKISIWEKLSENAQIHSARPLPLPWSTHGPQVGAGCTCLGAGIAMYILTTYICQLSQPPAKTRWLARGGGTQVCTGQLPGQVGEGEGTTPHPHPPLAHGPHSSCEPQPSSNSSHC